MRKIRAAEVEAAELTIKAETTSKELAVQGREQAIQLRQDVEQEVAAIRQELERQEARLQQREETLDRRQETVDKKEKRLDRRQTVVDRKADDIEKAYEAQLADFNEVTNMTQPAAKAELMGLVEAQSYAQMAQIIRQVQLDIQKEAHEKARELIILAMQRVATDQVSEATLSAVPLPSDDMKGRIIGRQGRNIRAFESSTGVEVIVDDTPEAVILTGFDPVRREIARLTMSRLVNDGRIHPMRIDRLMDKAQIEVENAIDEAGKKAVQKLGLKKVHGDLVKMLGRLNYRYIDGHNQLTQALETAQLAATIANEFGANAEVCREAGMLYNIGQAVPHDIEGHHLSIGVDVAKRSGINSPVIECLEAQYNPKTTPSLEAVILEMAVAIIASTRMLAVPRKDGKEPGMEGYVKRMKAIEDMARGVQGVEEALGMQAGRTIYVVVRSDMPDDYHVLKLSQDVTRRIEESMEYPGQIKVSVVPQLTAPPRRQQRRRDRNKRSDRNRKRN